MTATLLCSGCKARDHAVVRHLLPHAGVDPGRSRPDVVAARSRMRTKHGGRAAIAWVGDHLDADERLMHLARFRAAEGPTGLGPGVLALTDRRLLVVGDSLRDGDRLDLPLHTLVAVGQARGRRTGDLSVATARSAWELRAIPCGDLADVVETLARLRPDAVGSARVALPT